MLDTPSKTYHAAIQSVPMPPRIQWLPVNHEGLPIPWYAQLAKDRNKPTTAVRRRLCWLCGQPLGRNVAMSLSPLATLNRTTAEPPAHRDCAIFAAQGAMVARQNPPVFAIWIAREYGPFRTERGGVLLTFGDPEEVLWFADGRTATREEVLIALNSGVPRMMAMARAEGPESVKTIEAMAERAMAYLP